METDIKLKYLVTGFCLLYELVIAKSSLMVYLIRSLCTVASVFFTSCEMTLEKNARI